jgi:hypothetical protein
MKYEISQSGIIEEELYESSIKSSAKLAKFLKTGQKLISQASQNSSEKQVNVSDLELQKYFNCELTPKKKSASKFKMKTGMLSSADTKTVQKSKKGKMTKNVIS